MVLVVARDKVQMAMLLLKREGELAYEIGVIEASDAAEPQTIIV
jgi:phosphoribosylaminoimidazole (AIR) synthetase